jgi:hypothetical protein
MSVRLSRLDARAGAGRERLSFTDLLQYGDADEAAARSPPRPGHTFGAALHAMGQQAVGRAVLRNWPDSPSPSGGWWDAVISGYDAAMGA